MVPRNSRLETGEGDVCVFTNGVDWGIRGHDDEIGLSRARKMIQTQSYQVEIRSERQKCSDRNKNTCHLRYRGINHTDFKVEHQCINHSIGRVLTADDMFPTK